MNCNMLFQRNLLREFVFPLVILVLALWSPLVLAAGEPIDKRIEVSASEEIEIIVPRGKVQVIGVAGNTFHVKGTLDEELKKLAMKSDEGRTQFELIVPETLEHNSRNAGANLVFQIPHGALLKVQGTETDIQVEKIQGQTEVITINGDLQLKQLHNQIKASTVNGDLKGSNLKGSMEMKSVNGDVFLTKAQGTFELASVNGDMALELSSKQVKVELVNGDLELLLTQAEQAQLNNVNGEIEAQLPDAEKPHIQVSTVNGDASIKVPATINAKFNLAAKVGGDIDNEFNQQKPKSNEYGPGEWLNFSNGEGKGQVKMSTVNGSLEINKL